MDLGLGGGGGGSIPALPFLTTRGSDGDSDSRRVGAVGSVDQSGRFRGLVGDVGEMVNGLLLLLFLNGVEIWVIQKASHFEGIVGEEHGIEKNRLVLI